MSLHREARVVNDFHPFGAIHSRAERHLAPPVRHGRMGLYVLAAMGMSVAFTLALKRPLPKTINNEWKDAEAARAKLIMLDPMQKCAFVWSCLFLRSSCARCEAEVACEGVRSFPTCPQCFSAPPLPSPSPSLSLSLPSP